MAIKQTYSSTKLNNVRALKNLKTTLGLIIAAFTFLLYTQSISFDYTLDDEYIISNNSLITKGISAIPTLIKTDYWYGSNSSMRVDEYRPAPLIMLAIEWQFFPNNPQVYHLINVLLFTLVCWLLFLL